jgi:DNA modification methylase
VDEQGTILVGHGALLAALQLGLSKVPVVVLGHLTEQQKRAYMIADNQLAQNSHWDTEKLRGEIETLEKELFDVKVVGFDPEELDRILTDLAPEHFPRDADDVPGTEMKRVTEAGELWLLGRHRVLCGDGTRDDSLARVLEGRSAAMVFSDLPYNVNYKQRGGRSQSGIRQIANDNLGAEFEQFLDKACLQMLKVTQGALYLCMSSSELHTLYKAFTGAGGHWSTYLIWSKDTFTLGRSNYQRQYEPILYGWKKGQRRYWSGSRNQGDVLSIPKPRANHLHPNMKPIALVEPLIRNSCRRGDLVLDPFGGSGSTLIACEKSGRQARLIELEPRFVDVIVRRWENYTGQQAVRESDGQSFTSVAQTRIQNVA